MNLRPSGYEPDELPGCSTPRLSLKAKAGGDRRLGNCEMMLSIGLADAARFEDLATTYSPTP